MICKICNKDFISYKALSSHIKQNHKIYSENYYFADELTKLGIRFETQYHSDKYPFLCDFYLCDYDIYVELNIYWSHNDHFFDTSDSNDLEILRKWQSKANNGHVQYLNAINVWTQKDILKRDIAQKNNLNYVVLWSREEIDFYINYLKEII